MSRIAFQHCDAAQWSTHRTSSPVDRRVAELITIDAQVADTEPVIIGVPPGSKRRTSSRFRRLFIRFGLSCFDATVDFDAAARIYPSMPARRRHPAED